MLKAGSAETPAPHRHAVTWITGVGTADLKPAEARDRTGLPAGRADRLILTCAAGRTDSGQLRYGAVVPLFADLIDRLADAAPPLVRRYADGLTQLDPLLVPGAPPTGSPLDAHAVTFAIIRRISRESLDSAVRIDQAAMFLRDAVRRLAAGRATELWIPGLDLLDRPSLRVINRMIWLMEPADRMRVFGLCRGDPFAPDGPPSGPLARRRHRARRRLWERLAQEWEPQVVPLPGSRATGCWLPAPVVRETAAGADPAKILTAVAEELVAHNYDRAYLLAEAQLAAAEQDPRGDLWRLIGLCDANIGEPELAAEAFQAGLAAVTRPTQRAHLHYLRGLLLTKRHYDLAAADAEYRRGLAELATVPDDATPDDSLEGVDDVPFERAWLLNGRALVASLVARQLPPDDRTDALHAVLRQELGAFRLVGTGTQPRRVYLRYNLLANIAFVLEMSGQFGVAIDFWHRAFGQYLERPGGGRFETVYRYRVGLLEWKAGRTDAALDSLRTAAELARQAGDRFHAERIQYGVGFVLLDTGAAGAAVTAFHTGVRQAWQLRDPLAVMAHARALRSAAERAGRPRLIRALVRWLHATGHPTLRAATEAELAKAPERPSPKLPAYIPGIDLEPTPDVNLNVYLASAGWDRARPLTPGGGTHDR